MSQHGENFKEALNLKFNVASTRLPSSEWIPKHTKLKDKPFSFKDHEYQTAIVDDRSRVVATKKCAQIGVTEVFLRDTLRFLAQNQGSQAIFTQPTDTDAGRFAKSRVDTLFEECPIVKRLGTGGIDSTSLKRIGTSFLNIRGTFGAKSAISIPSDMNVYDEVNFSNPNVLSQYKSRLQHSVYKYERCISTPTIPGYGVSALYDNSDQKRITCCCTHCGHWQFLDWETNFFFKRKKSSIIYPKDPDIIDQLVDAEWDWEVFIGCEKCSKELDRSWEGGRREWVAAYPERDGISGYAIGQPDAAFIEAIEIVRSSDRRFPSGYKKVSDFYNFVLGQDYRDKEAGAIDDNTRALATISMASPAAATGTFIGVDLGNNCHITVIKDLWVNSRLRPTVIATFEIQKDELETKIPDLMLQYRTHYLVSDALPYTTTVEKLAKASDRMSICFYGGKKQYTVSKHTVTANRTSALDEVTGGLSKGEILVASELAYADMFWAHCKNLMKVRAEDDDGEEYYDYIKVGDDHFGHSLGYAMLAREIYMEMKRGESSGDAPVEVSGVRTSL